MTGQHPLGHIGTCQDCGKRCYTSRKDAKRVARNLPGTRLSAYQCGRWWHLGHLPRPVIRGRANRDEIINNRKATR